MTHTDTVASLPFPVHPRTAGDPEPDLTGFRLIHRALRSGVRTVGDVGLEIAAGAPCPPERQEAIVWFAGHVLQETHAHHEKEDDVLWPVIVASAGERVDLEPLTDDHKALAGLLRSADALLVRFGTDVSAAAELGAAMIEIADELDEHIEDEEATVFPVMLEYVSKRDFAGCEKRFQKGTPLRHMVFMLPWLMAQCSPAERAELLPTAPVPLRLLLRMVEGRWQRRAALVRG